MFKKMLPWLVIILVSITLIISAAFILTRFMDSKDDSSNPHQQALDSVKSVEAEQLPAKEVAELTVEVKDLITNLANRDQIKLSFAFQMDNKKAKEELETISFIVNSTIMQTLADTQPEEIQGSKGLDNFCAKLMNRINPILAEGKIKHIYITNIILI